MRRSYATDAGLLDQVFDLLRGVWGAGIGAARHASEALGVGWETASIPFVAKADGAVVSHVGLVPLPLVVRGRSIVAGGIHGVATLPTHRGKGLSRSLMEEAIEFGRARYDTLLLTTAEPVLYRRYGFRHVPEAVFTGPVDHPGGGPGFRALDPGRREDSSLIHRLLEARAPVSAVLGVGREKAVFGFNEGQGPLWYSDALDCLVLHELGDGRLRLFDLIGPRIPSAAVLLAEVAEPIRELVTFFSPDRLGCELEPRPHPRAGGPYAMDVAGDNTVLMASGRFAPGGPMMLPRSVRC